MLKKKSSLLSNILLFSFSAILFVVSIVGYSFAWFTDSGNLTISGTTPNVVIQVLRPDANNVFKASDVYTYHSGDAFQQFKFKSSSNVGVYVRAQITANWSDNDMSHKNPFEVMTFTLGSGWYAMAGANDNQKIQNGWLYYGSSSSPTAVSDTDSRTILSSLAVKSGETMPANLEIQVYVEAVQANSLGISKFGTAGTHYPNAWVA